VRYFNAKWLLKEKSLNDALEEALKANKLLPNNL